MGRKQMSKEIITEVKVLPEVEVPQPVKDALLGSAEGGLQEKNRAEYFALVVFLQAWQDPTLLEDESIKTQFEGMKQRICRAIAELDPYPFTHFAEALEKRDSTVGHTKRAIAATFLTLRYKHGERKIPMEELKDQARRQYPELREEEPCWHREFEELGIKDFLIPEKQERRGPKPKKKPN
jgi:hypothetical protein